MEDAHPIYLQTEALRIGYPINKKSVPLFDDLNLTLRGGELVCLMGANGAGKSTLIRTLAGLQKPLYGTVRLREEIPLHQQIAVVLTDRLAPLNMTAYELISFGRYPYLPWSIRMSEADRQVINKAVDQMHLRSLLTKRLFELSDGQVQMVMLARALAQDTPIILLDEPTAHLDLNNRLEIMNILRHLAHETKKAILVSTHDLDLALQTADLIWLATKNQQILTGIPEDLVLDGTFDAVFEFKGFDLKTGKVQHTAHRNINIQLKGEGYPFLWTKNALERCGFNITDSPAEVRITIRQEENKFFWELVKDQQHFSLTTLAALIKLL